MKFRPGHRTQTLSTLVVFFFYRTHFSRDVKIAKSCKVCLAREQVNHLFLKVSVKPYKFTGEIKMKPLPRSFRPH